MRFVDVTAIVEGRLVGFRLTLAMDWLEGYVRRRERLDRPAGR
jgi:hypothetical protein